MHNMPQSRGLGPNYHIMPGAKVSAGKPWDGCPPEQIGIGPVEQLQCAAEPQARRGGTFRMPLCAALDMPEAGKLARALAQLTNVFGTERARRSR